MPVNPFQVTQHIDVEYSDTRLEEVIGFLRYETGMNIVVNWAELEASGIDVDTPVSMVLKDTTPHTVLGLLIQLVNSSSGDLIDYTVMDDVIMITSADNISAMRVVRIYDCLDLMNPGASTAASPTAPVNALAVTPGRRGGRSANTGNFTAPGGMEMGGFDGGMGMDMQPTYGGGYGGGQANSFHRSADQATELLNVIHTLLDSHGSVSYYDGMLVVIAGHKTHQRIQETLMLVRATQAKR